MKTLLKSRAFLAAAAALSLGAASLPVSAAPWVTAHYPYYQTTTLPPDSIDMSAITHLIYFAALPQSNGDIDTSHLDPLASQVKTRAHNASKKVILCVGGAGTNANFSNAIKAANRGNFVTKLALWVKNNGFDGVDVDMEPITSGDAANFQTFVQNLSAALKADNSAALLTGDFMGDSTTMGIVLPIKDYFDQINLMTYDLSGPYQGWATWHDSPLFNDGRTFPNPNDGTLPSCDKTLLAWIAAGFPAAKLGMGVNCWGHKWAPATALQQVSDGMTYTDINYREAEALRTVNNYHYDAGAQAPYLLTANSFISYTDATLCTAKTNYVNTNGLGGLMLWDISAQFVNGQHPLLTAIKNAIGAPVGQPGISIKLGNDTLLANGTSTVDFGSKTINQLSPLTFTLTNTGTAPLTGLELDITGSKFNQFLKSNLTATTLDAGASMSFEVSFGPTLPGPHTAILHVTSNSTVTPSFDINLKGFSVNFSKALGTYAGTAASGDHLLVLTTMATGTFSAKYVAGNTYRTFTGKFDQNNHFSGNVGTPPLAVDLQLQPNGSPTNPGGYLINGTIAGTAVNAWHTVYLKGQPLAVEGKYTLLLDPTQVGTTVAPGFGFATLSVGKTGLVTVAGKLGEGSSFSTGGAIVGSAGGTSRYVALLSNTKHLLAGPIDFIPGAFSHAGGSLLWVKKPSTSKYYGAGFNTRVNAYAARYAKPAANTMVLPFADAVNNGALYLDGDGMSATIFETVTLSTLNKVTVTGNNDAKVKLTFTPSTGRFSGSFVDPASKKTITLSGALYQHPSEPRAAGMFLTPVTGGIGYGGRVGMDRN